MASIVSALNVLQRTARSTARRHRRGGARSVKDSTVTVLRTDQVAEERDLVGVYLHEISRTPLLDAAREVELSKAIEGGLYAQHLLDEETLPDGVERDELKAVVVD